MSRTQDFQHRRTFGSFLAVFVLSLAGCFSPIAASGGTLEEIQARGVLRCGVVDVGVGITSLGDTGTWEGFFPEFCRFLAAATLGDANAVSFVEVNMVVRFDALRSREFDVLMANTTWTAERDTTLGISFAHPIIFDGQGFLAHASLKANSLADLQKDTPITICVADGTTTVQNLNELMEETGIPFDPIILNSTAGMYESFFARDCEVVTDDRSSLSVQRPFRTVDPDNYILLSDTISKEPLAPAVLQDDQVWFDIVQWSIYATLLAEEHGITSENVSVFKGSENPGIRRLLGVEPGIGAALGLSEHWAYQGILQVGSYKEIFDRTLGEESPIMMERGLNALWTEGGLMYAPPLR